VLPKDLPWCICLAHDYCSGGGQFGGERSSQWFTCEACGRPLLLVSHYMTALLIPKRAVTEFPQEGIDYVNGPLDVTMRAYKVAVEEVREAAERAEWDIFCDMRGYPRGTKVGHGVRGERCLCHPDGRRLDGERAIERADALFDARRGRGRVLFPPPIPPRIPDCLIVFVPEGGWHEVNRGESAALHVPPDPRRRAHDERFGRLFAEIRDVGPNLKVEEIPNDYHEDKNRAEPWYAFGYGMLKFRVGPRKRVISIEAESFAPFQVRRLRLLAEQDKVTYEASGGWEASATKVLIHAWTDEKFVEYMMALLEGL
jgi:hypothetical protein